MSYQPTPETERIKGALHTNWNDLMNHARKLERERDEARKEAEYYKERYEQLKDERDEAIAGRQAYKQLALKHAQERDKAREALRQMWQSGDAFLPYIDKETTNRWRRAAGWEETK